MRTIIGISEVRRRTGRSTATIRRYLATPQIGFPRPVDLGPRDRGWYEDEIEQWIASRPRREGETLNLRLDHGRDHDDAS